MKKRLLSILISLLVFVSVSSASCSNLFYYDKENLTNEMAGLNHPETTLTNLINNNCNLLANMNISEIFSPNITFDGPPLGIPSFLYGCCFGPVGLVTIYIMTDNDRNEVNKAFTGCMILFLFYVAISIYSILNGGIYFYY